VHAVEQRAGGDELDRLALAAALARQVEQLGDDLLRYFVDAARQAGLSWSQIGSALDTSKQAAQQRFVSPDLSRYTQGARRAVDNAGQAARAFGHRWVGSEHLLIGLAEVSDGIAAKALRTYGGITADAIEAKLALLDAPAQAPLPETVPLTAGVAKLLGDAAPAEATTLGHNYVGTEHILLALLRQQEARGTMILTMLSVETDALRERVLRLMTETAPAGSSN
jgi:Clp amino terminal domain, pathogenicity island component